MTQYVTAFDASVQAACKYHEVTPSLILGPKRHRDIVDARHMAMASLKNLRPDLSTPAIGRMFNRDHTTVLSAFARVKKRCEDVPDFRVKLKNCVLLAQAKYMANSVRQPVFKSVRVK